MTTRPEVQPTAASRRFWIGVAAVTLLGAGLTWMQLDWFILPSADSTTYAILAEALATGQGYRLISEPAQPAMNFYPPGLPLLLAAIVRGTIGWGWVPADGLMALVLPMKIVPWLSFVGSIPLLAVVARSRATTPVALAAALLWAVNPVAGSFANAIMAEMPLIALSLLAMALLERLTMSPPRLVWAIAGGLVLAAAFYMRTSAIFLVAAALAWLLLRRQLRMACVVGCVVLACAVPWLLRSAANPTSGSPVVGSYVDQLLAVETYATQRVDAAGIVARGLASAGEYVSQHVPAMVWPHSVHLPGVLRLLLGLLLVLLAVWGVVQGWRLGPGLAEVYTVVFVVSTLVWPWRGSRFLLPVLPLLLLALVVGGDHVIRRLARRRQAARFVGWIEAVVLLWLVLSPLWVSLSTGATAVQQDRQPPLRQALAAQPGWTGYLDALAWLQATAPDDSVIMGRNARMAYLLIQRRGVDYPFDTDPARLNQVIEANGVDYVIEDQFAWTDTTRLFLQPAMQALAAQRAGIGGFALAYAAGDPPTRVWRVLPLEER